MATEQRSSANGMPAVGVREGIEVNEFEFEAEEVRNRVHLLFLRDISSFSGTTNPQH